MTTLKHTQFRLVGEDAPVWAGAAAAAFGLLLALAAGAQVGASLRPDPHSPGIAAVEPAPAPQSLAETHAPAEAPPLRGPEALRPSAPAADTPGDQQARSGSLFGSLPETQPPAIVSIAPEVPPVEVAKAEPAKSEPIAPFCLPVVAIPFDLDSARLKPAGLAETVAPLRDFLLAHGDAVLSVEGHADQSGGESYNVVLSFNRAQAVAAWLGRSGLPAERIATRAAGTRSPTVATNVSSNRQVILQVEGVEPCRLGALSAATP